MLTIVKRIQKQNKEGRVMESYDWGDEYFCQDGQARPFSGKVQRLAMREQVRIREKSVTSRGRAQSGESVSGVCITKANMAETE